MSDTGSTDSSEIVFEEGLIGVPRARRFVLLERAGSPVRVLRCLDIEGFALPVVDPTLADAGYRPQLGPRILDVLGFEKGDSVLLLVVAALEPDGPTANLRAPLVIHPRLRRAAQVILDDRTQPLRARVDVNASPRSGDSRAENDRRAAAQGQEVPRAGTHP